MDNYHNSFALLVKLRQLGIYTCGTHRLNRNGQEELIKIKKSIKKNEIIYFFKEGVEVMVWCDKKPVTIIPIAMILVK